MVELEIRWPSAEYAEVPIGAPIDLGEATGLTESELIQFFANVAPEPTLFARGSSQGKGASGPAFAIVVEIERWATDAASVLALGTGLVQLIRALAKNGRHQAVIEDPNTLGAIALAETQVSGPMADTELEELNFVSTVPITAFPGIGTNGSDIWAACFKARSGDAVVVFLSPTGTWLGKVRVPAEYYFDGSRTACQRTAREIQQWWS